LLVPLHLDHLAPTVALVGVPRNRSSAERGPFRRARRRLRCVRCADVANVPQGPVGLLECEEEDGQEWRCLERRAEKLNADWPTFLVGLWPVSFDCEGVTERCTPSVAVK